MQFYRYITCHFNKNSVLASGIKIIIMIIRCTLLCSFQLVSKTHFITVWKPPTVLHCYVVVWKPLVFYGWKMSTYCLDGQWLSSLSYSHFLSVVKLESDKVKQTSIPPSFTRLLGFYYVLQKKWMMVFTDIDNSIMTDCRVSERAAHSAVVSLTVMCTSM